jgi:hypothetical protein
MIVQTVRRDGSIWLLDRVQVWSGEKGNRSVQGHG